MAHGFRGIYLNNLGRFEEALPEFEIANASHRQFGASVSIAYMDGETCRSFIGLAQWGPARLHCDRARTEFTRLGESGLPQTELLTAEIDLAENKVDDARHRLDEIINQNAGPATVNEFEPFRLRAEVNRRSGDLSAALLDFYQYIERYRRWKDAATARQMLVLSARFTTDLQAIKVETLQKTLSAERDIAHANNRNLLISVVALALGLMILCRMHYLDLRHRRHLTEIANTDSLTGLPNRRHTLDRAAALRAEARESGHAFSIALVDLDHFKAINDNYGHLAGDLVLKSVASAAVEKLPSGALIGRWGGEEFLIIFHRCLPEDCVAHLTRLRQQVTSVRTHHAEAIPVNFSAGVAGDDHPDLAIDQIIERADKALYRAKAAGRGQTCLSRSGPSAVSGANSRST